MARNLYFYLLQFAARKGYSILLLAGALTVLSGSTFAQTISTVAGNGTAGYMGDGGPATAAEIAYPWGIAVDNSGNFYIASEGWWWWWWGTSGSVVRKVNAAGTITTYAGTTTWGFSGDGGPATAAELDYPMGVATDASGNLYISDYGNYRIRKVNVSTGIITTIAGNGTPGSSGDGGPATAASIFNYSAIAVDPSGNVYIDNFGYYKIRKIDTSGIITTVAGSGLPGSTGDGGAATAARIGDVYGLAVDASGNIYIADYGFGRVRMVNTSGIISTFAGNGGSGYSGDGGPATAAQVGTPIGVAVDGAGNVHIVDEIYNRIRKVNSAGIITTEAGTGAYNFSGDGGPATAATFRYPYGVAADAGGNVYITDYDNIRVRKITNFNRPPQFTGGHSQYLTVCENTIGDSINSLLAVMDSDVAQPETWSLLAAPHHGTASILDTSVSTGSVIAAHHNYYTPATGYNGYDTFRVTVNDGYALDTTTIYVTINPIPSAIIGGTSFAVGGYSLLSDATPGGTWSSSSTAIATVGTAGMVSGISAGTAVITYTLATTGCINTKTVNVFTGSGNIITTIAGTGTAGYSGDGSAATAAKINRPMGTATDAAGNVYIADELNNRIRKVSTTGIISTICGNGTPGFSGDGAAATAAQLNGPYYVYVDGAGDVYIADNGNHRVRMINTSGIIMTVAGNGSSAYSGDGLAATAAGLGSPSGITTDATGNLYICADGVRVRKVNTGGIISTFAGSSTTGYSGDGLAATAAQLNNPAVVTADASGNIYIADQINNRIRKVNTSGIISTFAGNGTAGYSGDGAAATAAALNNPWGVAADALGNIYIGDQSNNRVRMVSPSGTISTLAGTGTAGYSGDGCAATASKINLPLGLCTDGTGSVYIPDAGNHRVRKVYTNHSPAFSNHILSTSVCASSVDSLNSLLAITDVDAGQGETWAVLTPAISGTVAATYTTTSTGGTVRPAGLYYQPTTGFTGADSFTVTITDCSGGTDTTKVRVTVTPLPSAISGAPTVCSGLTTTYVDTVGSGVWSSSNTAIATVGSTGVVAGVSAGTAIITYAPGAGCSITKTVTVIASPAVSGSHNLCMGTPAPLTGTPGGGVWSSSNTAVATIGSSSGIASGVSLGVSNITYTQSVCYMVYPVTVNAATPLVTGVPVVCVGAPQALFDIGGGVWSSANPAVATIDSFTGIFNGIAAGSATISYTQTDGCYAIMVVTVDPAPSPIIGPSTVCVGLTDTLSDTTVGGGVWHATGLSFSATIDSLSGILTGVSAGFQTIEFTSYSTYCSVTKTVTVTAVPPSITGADTLCIGTTTALADATPGGTWSSTAPAVATVGSTGIVAGVATGTATISYLLSGGCYATATVTVRPNPAAITGTVTVCVGLSTTLSDITYPGVWSSGSTAIATIGSTGIVTGASAGVAVISYTNAGCSATRSVTVNTTPAAIGGSLAACLGGSPDILNDATPGGTWTSGTTTVATIGSTSGTVTAHTTGTTLITYSLGAGCSTTALLTVNPTPSAITGSLRVCAGSTTTLSDLPSGGTWTASGVAATIGSSSGIVSGISTGTSGVTYTLNGCPQTATVTVNPLPAAITGPATVCPGAAISLSDATGSGTWSSSNPATGTVSTTGVVTGIAPGTTIIAYQLSTGCQATKIITVNLLPATPTGAGSLCQGATTTLSDTGSGTWSTTGTVATVGSLSGVVSGIGSGTAAITYTTGGTGCSSIKNITVNPLPSITGPTAVCVGATITDLATPPGTWASSNPAVATVGSSSGMITGVTTGTVTMTCTSAAGCASNVTVTVSLSPTPITGPSAVCTGTNATYTDGVGGGVWMSSAPATATIGSLSGIATGVTTGTATITYSLGTGCTVTKPITVTVSPAAITGTLGLCVSTSVTLADGTPGGTWHSSTPAIATVGTGGLVSGVAAGTDTISYTAGGCPALAVVTVNTSPAAIGGPSLVCTGTTIAETDAVAGGVWTSSNPAVAAIGSTGIVTGAGSGTATITYAIGSCTTTRTVTVSAAAAISGATGLCVGATGTLSCPGGGTWSSSNPAVATIGSSTGLVHGITTGTAGITYTLGTGCVSATTITVNNTPTAITGTLRVCAGDNTTLGDGAGGGTWTSSAPAIATIGSLSGVATGVAPGTATITYSLGSGCTTIATVTVLASPASITGAASVCAGSTTTLSDVTAGGTWSSSNTAIAGVGSLTGVVSGIAAGNSTISYTLSNGCAATDILTVNPLPAAISGTAMACTGQTATLTDATTGGTWSSGSTWIATIGSATGVVTGITPGTSVIAYTLPTGCTATVAVTVNGAPSAITGIASLCTGQATTLGDALPGGTWSSSDPAVAAMGTAAGVVNGISAGTAMISYTVSGCSATTTVTVSAPPVPISGPAAVCAGGTASFTDGTPGGTWSSSNLLIATVGSSGTVTGVTAGSVTISYSLGAGCTVAVPVTVQPGPAAITGSPNICIGTTVTLADVTPGGVWSSSNNAIAAMGSGGMVRGATAGTATISYTAPSGCAATLAVSVIVVPAISGIHNLCAWGDTLTVSDTNTTGAYSSTLVTVVNLGSGIGYVTAFAPGLSSITYTLPSGCSVTSTLTTNPLPSLLSGSDKLCTGTAITMSDTTSGGTWSSSNTAVGTISSIGMITGISTGTTRIAYTLPTGCKADTLVTVVIPPTHIAGTATVCAGATTALSDTVTGGVWSSSNTAIATAGSSGLITGVAAGTATITYTMATACTATKTVTVTPLPAAYTVTGGGSYCAGGAGEHVGLAGSHNGISYQLYRGTATVGTPVTGTGAAIDFGLQTAAGTYTVAARDTTSGCNNNMTGSVAISIQPSVTPAVSIGVAPGTSLCAGTIAMFTATPTNGGTTPAYQWTVNGAGAATGNTYSYTPANGDVVSVLMASSAACAAPDSVTNAVAMTVTNMVIPSVTITAHPGTTLVNGQTDTFTATVTGGGASPTYQWVVNSIPVAGANAATYITSSLFEGDTVSCMVTNNDPCGEGGSQYVVIHFSSAVGLVTTEDVISVSPNPNKGTFNIKGSLGVAADEEVAIEVTDIIGQVVYRESFMARGGKISRQVTLASEANGMYLLTVHTTAGNKVFHLVVER